MGENDENAATGSNALLAEILGVLKRIDGHLEAQESRIGLLDAKVTALASTTNHIDNPDIADRRASLGPVRKKSDPPNISPPRPRDLRLQIANRADSVGSRGPRGSVASQESRSWPGTHAWSPSGPKSVKSSRTTPRGSASNAITSSPKVATISRTGTWHSIPPPPTTAESEHIEVDDDPAYSKFPPPEEWITTRSLGRVLDVKYGSAEAKTLWTRYLGDSWTIPPDGRIEMTFQQHLLERLDKDKVIHLLQTLRDVSNRLEYQHAFDSAKRGSFRVTDIGFDPGFEDSVAEYRAEVLTAKYREYPVSNRGKRAAVNKVQTAPWKRMMRVPTLPTFPLLDDS